MVGGIGRHRHGAGTVIATTAMAGTETAAGAVIATGEIKNTAASSAAVFF